MSGYEVIARRWRPQQFDDLVGQDHIVRTLKNAITQDRIAHAYLFVGPRGTGKTSTARIFAKALNAEGGPTVTPDENSEISRAIMAGNAMDVIEIDAASNTSVDYIRELRESCQYAPAVCTYKIYIIDEVHMLSTGAFNALLKTLEEPPPHVKFIFATTEAQKLLPTIVSRCQRFEFRPIADARIIERLQRIAQAENINVDEAALASIARLAQGGMRDAQSILDQLISFCGANITEKDVLDVYGLTAAQSLQSLAGSVVQADYAGILQQVEDLAGEGVDLYRTLLDLQQLMRSVLLDAVHGSGQSDQLGATVTADGLQRILAVLHEGEGSVQKGLSAQVNFEVVLLQAAEAGKARAIDTVIRQLSQIAQTLPAEDVKKKTAQLGKSQR